MKKYKLSPCPKTVSGIHKFVKASLYRGISESLISPIESDQEVVMYTKCFACGLINDVIQINEQLGSF